MSKILRDNWIDFYSETNISNRYIYFKIIICYYYTYINFYIIFKYIIKKKEFDFEKIIKISNFYNKKFKNLLNSKQCKETSQAHSPCNKHNPHTRMLLYLVWKNNFTNLKIYNMIFSDLMTKSPASSQNTHYYLTRSNAHKMSTKSNSK